MSLSKELQAIKQKVLLNLSELEEFFAIVESKASNLDNHEKELEDLNNKVEEKRTELESFRRVSFISNMSKQLKEKDNYIEVLERRLSLLKQKQVVKQVDKQVVKQVDKQVDKQVVKPVHNLVDKILKHPVVELEEPQVVIDELEVIVGDESESDDEDSIEVIRKKYKGVYYYVSEIDKTVFKIETDKSIGQKVGFLNKKGRIRLN